jgi:hypothetical protein
MLNILPAATALPFHLFFTKQVVCFRLLRQPVLSWFLYQPTGKRQSARLKTADQNPFMATHRQQSLNGIGASVTSISLRSVNHQSLKRLFKSKCCLLHCLPPLFCLLFFCHPFLPFFLPSLNKKHTPEPTLKKEDRPL